VIAGVVLERRRVLLVSKRAAPDVFFLPGGKPEPGEESVATLARELDEELGVRLVESELLAVVRDEAAIERVRMELHVYLATVEAPGEPRAEIAATAWVGADGECPGELAPAIANHVLPLLRARSLID
jgi:8-oxo-dGTP diphosphatase